MTAACRATDRPTAAQSQRLANRPWKALAWSERALNTLNSWNSVSVVKAMVWA